MNYAFFGTPDFADAVLQALIAAGMPPSLAVCNPDRPKGRKNIITPPPVKVRARACGIPVLQPEAPHEAILTLRELNPDFLLVVAYAKIIPKEILGVPRLGAIGLHPSLLPRHRGATPIQSAILQGDKETGVTIYLLDEKIDHGPVLVQRSAAAEGQNYVELSRALAELGGGLLVEILPKFLNGAIRPRPQDESLATYTKKLSSDDGFIAPPDLAAAERGQDPHAARVIMRKILALNPEPGAWTVRDGKRVKLLEAEVKGGALTVKKIQVEGGKPRIASSSS